MKVLITGATGFIGSELTQRLLDQNDQVVVLTRDAEKARKQLGSRPEVITSLETYTGDIDAVVNLAGAAIADERWSDERKAVLMQSRLETTQAVVDWCEAHPQQVKCFISGSAIGYYGSSLSDDKLTEDDGHGKGFASDLCVQWEAVAQRAEDFVERLCIIRTGVVLGEGGALKKMLPAFRMGFGGPISPGSQWMSWISLNDEVRAILHLLNSKTSSGVYNLTAPRPVTNVHFTKVLAASLHRPAFFSMPSLAAWFMLGEGEELLTKGQRVMPERLLAEGFEFECDHIDYAFVQFQAAA